MYEIVRDWEIGSTGTDGLATGLLETLRRTGAPDTPRAAPLDAPAALPPARSTCTTMPARKGRVCARAGAAPRRLWGGDGVGRAAAAATAATAATVAAAHPAGSNRLAPKGALQRRAGGRWKRDARPEMRWVRVSGGTPLAKADSRNFGKSGESNFRLDARGLRVLHAAGTQRP